MSAVLVFYSQRFKFFPVEEGEVSVYIGRSHPGWTLGGTYSSICDKMPMSSTRTTPTKQQICSRRIILTRSEKTSHHRRPSKNREIQLDGVQDHREVRRNIPACRSTSAAFCASRNFYRHPLNSSFPVGAVIGLLLGAGSAGTFPPFPPVLRRREMEGERQMTP